MSYNLTDKQKKFVKWFVNKANSGNLSEEFTIIRYQGRFDIDGYTGEKDEIPEISNAILNALAYEDMLHCTVNYNANPKGHRSESSRIIVITGKAYEAVKNDLIHPKTSPQVSIGAIINPMSGGNLQAIGIAQDTDIKKIINDPKLFQPQVEALTENILNEAKNHLTSEDLLKYTQSVINLKNEILKENPNFSIIKKLVSTVSFLGSIFVKLLMILVENI